MYEIDDRYGQIMALVVSETHRRQGVGALLVAGGRIPLVERGAAVSIVTSANRRADAHAFYETTATRSTAGATRKRWPATSEAT